MLGCPPGPDGHPKPGAAHPAPRRPSPSPPQGPRVGPQRPHLSRAAHPAGLAHNSQGLLWLRGGSSGFTLLPPAPSASRFNRITSWSKYAGQPENQSHHNQRLVNCNVAETHPSHPPPLPSPHPSPLLFVPLRVALLGKGKSDQNCRPPTADFSMDSVKATLTISLINGWHLWLKERRWIRLCLRLC